MFELYIAKYFTWNLYWFKMPPSDRENDHCHTALLGLNNVRTLKFWTIMWGKYHCSFVSFLVINNGPVCKPHAFFVWRVVYTCPLLNFNVVYIRTIFMQNVSVLEISAFFLNYFSQLGFNSWPYSCVFFMQSIKKRILHFLLLLKLQKFLPISNISTCIFKTTQW